MQVIISSVKEKDIIIKAGDSTLKICTGVDGYGETFFVQLNDQIIFGYTEGQPWAEHPITLCKNRASYYACGVGTIEAILNGNGDGIHVLSILGESSDG